jgi:hypothetical protein
MFFGVYLYIVSVRIESALSYWNQSDDSWGSVTTCNSLNNHVNSWLLWEDHVPWNKREVEGGGGEKSENLGWRVILTQWLVAFQHLILVENASFHMLALFWHQVCIYMYEMFCVGVWALSEGPSVITGSLRPSVSLFITHRYTYVLSVSVFWKREYI